jgi:PAS domain-containing protein
MHPIDILTQTVSGLTTGKFSHSDLEAVRLNTQEMRSRDDEIGMLADSFHQMSEQLQETLSSLQAELEEHKRIDAELEKERRILANILENDPSGVALVDRKGIFQYLNSEFTRITGYTLQDIPSEKDWLPRPIRIRLTGSMSWIPIGGTGPRPKRRMRNSS